MWDMEYILNKTFLSPRISDAISVSETIWLLRFVLSFNSEWPLHVSPFYLFFSWKHRLIFKVLVLQDLQRTHSVTVTVNNLLQMWYQFNPSIYLVFVFREAEKSGPEAQNAELCGSEPYCVYTCKLYCCT